MRIAVVAVGMLLLAGTFCRAGGMFPETDGKLALNIVMPGGDLRVGDRVDFELRFENVSGDSLRIYHPADSIYSYLWEWTLAVRLVDPAGAIWDAEPNWRYSMPRFPSAADFRWLSPGEAIRFPFSIKPVDRTDRYPTYPVSGGGDEWYVSVPLNVDQQSIDPDSLREATGITHFDTYWISSADYDGEKHYLLVISVLEAVFRKPGTYRIEVEYHNGVDVGYRDAPDAERVETVNYQDCWTGRLSASVEFEIQSTGD